VKRLELKEGTYCYYRYNTEAHIVPGLGHIKLQKQTADHDAEGTGKKYKVETHKKHCIQQDTQFQRSVGRQTLGTIDSIIAPFQATGCQFSRQMRYNQNNDTI